MRPQYQGFRFLAAALVFLSHAPTLQAFDFPSVRAANGAVAFFFVLSGFLLGLNDKGEPFSLAGTAKYLWSKVRKFYPLLVLTIVTSGYFVRGLLCLLRGENPIGAVWQSSPVWHFLLLQSWVPSSVYDFNGAAWFLSTLMFLYLVARLLLPPMRRLSCRGLLVTSLVLAVASFLCLWASEVRICNWFFTYVFPPSRSLEFVAALAAGCLCRKSEAFERARGGSGVWSGLEFLALAVWTAVLSVPLDLLPSITSRWTLPSLFLLLVFGVGRGVFSKVFGSRTMVALGACSMPLYLLHERVITFVGGLCEGHGVLPEKAWAKTATLAGTFALTLLLSGTYVRIRARFKRT